jgi:hypothetical protein
MNFKTPNRDSWLKNFSFPSQENLKLMLGALSLGIACVIIKQIQQLKSINCSFLTVTSFQGLFNMMIALMAW